MNEALDTDSSLKFHQPPLQKKFVEKWGAKSNCKVKFFCLMVDGMVGPQEWHMVRKFVKPVINEING